MKETRSYYILNTDYSEGVIDLYCETAAAYNRETRKAIEARTEEERKARHESAVILASIMHELARMHNARA